MKKLTLIAAALGVTLIAACSNEQYTTASKDACFEQASGGTYYLKRECVGLKKYDWMYSDEPVKKEEEPVLPVK